MKLKRTWLALPAVVVAAVFSITGVATASSASQSPGSTDYYLSLGDSLSVGFQPDAHGVGRPTDHGFDHDLLPGLRLVSLLHGRNLNLAELGCPSETTTTMINGGICTYPHARSQLDAAITFLTQHRGHVPLVTISIGASDVEDCGSATGIDAACLQRGLADIQTNLTTIVTALKKADPGTNTRFIGLNEYDPFLAAFLQGAAGQQLAMQSVTVVDQLNKLLAAAYGQAGFRVADVASAYRIDDFADQTTLPGHGQVPVNVANLCKLTFECDPAPVGPNIHPRDSGYLTMAGAVAAKL